MTTDPECLQASLPSPLEGFDFTRDWLHGEPFPRRLLPAIDEQLNLRLAALETGAWTPWTSAEIAELKEFNLTTGNSAGARLADALARQETLVVVTGQQPNLLASPLYILHKALSARAWAAKVAEKTSRTVIPVFWVASDDDDFAELKQAWHVREDGSIRDVGTRLSRGAGATTGSPAYRWDLSESAARLTEELQDCFAGWPDGESTSRWLADAINQHSNFEELFCFLLQQLLGPENPMLFVAPRLASLRRRQAAILSADIEKHGSLNVAVSSDAADFEKMGYPVSLQREPEALNFFWLHDGLRYRLLKTVDGIAAIDPRRRTEARVFSQQELHDLLQSDPCQFAPNVVTRPVLQDTALPTAAYIAGPGELAYLAVLGQAYQAFGQQRAAVIPRTLVSMSLGGSRCQPVPGTAPEEILSNSGTRGEALLAQLAELSAANASALQEMRAEASDLPSEVHVSLDKTEKHMQHGLEILKRRLARQADPGQWHRAARRHALLAPAGGPQERRLSPWTFAKAGEWDALAKHLLAHVDYTAQKPELAPLPPWMDKAL